MNDTHPEAARIMYEGMRKMSASDKFHMIWKLREMIDSGVYQDLQVRYPELADREIRLMIAARHISPELMKKAFDWPPEPTSDDDA